LGVHAASGKAVQPGLHRGGQRARVRGVTVCGQLCDHFLCPASELRSSIIANSAPSDGLCGAGVGSRSMHPDGFRTLVAQGIAGVAQVRPVGQEPDRRDRQRTPQAGRMVPRGGLEPPRLAAADFKSATSTGFVIGAERDLTTARPGATVRGSNVAHRCIGEVGVPPGDAEPLRRALHHQHQWPYRFARIFSARGARTRTPASGRRSPHRRPVARRHGSGQRGVLLEARAGIEPTYTALQAAA
jgi:hypothetical protein